MALTPGQIPSPHEKFTDPTTGGVTRTWWRVLNSLGKLAGTLASPITVPANSVFKSGTINSGSTLEAETIASGTLLGNSSGTDEAASPQNVDGTLELEGGALGLAQQAPLTLLGNVGGVAAQPGPVAIGSGFTISPTDPPTLSVGSGGGGGPPGAVDLTAAQLMSWWRGV